MTEITVESIEPEPVEAPAAAEPAEAEAPPPPVLERQPVAFQTTGGEVAFEAAPKKRGRPKAAPKPKSEAKPRGRPKAAPEPVVESPEPPPLDVNALLTPLLQAYMLNSHVAQRQAKAQRNRTLAQSMFSRSRQRFAENHLYNK